MPSTSPIISEYSSPCNTPATIQSSTITNQNTDSQTHPETHQQTIIQPKSLIDQSINKRHFIRLQRERHDKTGKKKPKNSVLSGKAPNCSLSRNLKSEIHSIHIWNLNLIISSSTKFYVCNILIYKNITDIFYLLIKLIKSKNKSIDLLRECCVL